MFFSFLTSLCIALKIFSGFKLKTIGDAVVHLLETICRVPALVQAGVVGEGSIYSVFLLEFVYVS